MSADAHANLEALLEKNRMLYEKVEKLGVHITEEIAFKDKHSRRYKGYLIDSESDSIITFATI